MSVKKALLLAVSLMGVVAIGAGLLTLLDGRSRVTPGDGTGPRSATDSELSAAADSQVFFAHQSVGYNILDALPGVYGAHGLDFPSVLESAEPDGAAHFQHVPIGTNGDPLGKIREFDEIIRGGVGEETDVALLKLCYDDIREGDDVKQIFAAYSETIAALERDYPDVTFLYTTVPVTAERGPRGIVKALAGRGDRLGPEHNVPREHYNQLVRESFADSGRLFDIAAVESTTPEGDRVVGEADGEPYYAMYGEHASDPGHLNAQGAAIAAEVLLSIIGEQVALGR